jgi:hypothetical protein
VRTPAEVRGEAAGGEELLEHRLPGRAAGDHAEAAAVAKRGTRGGVGQAEHGHRRDLPQGIEAGVAEAADQHGIRARAMFGIGVERRVGGDGGCGAGGDVARPEAPVAPVKVTPGGAMALPMATSRSVIASVVLALMSRMRMRGLQSPPFRRGASRARMDGTGWESDRMRTRAAVAWAAGKPLDVTEVEIGGPKAAKCWWR